MTVEEAAHAKDQRPGWKVALLWIASIVLTITIFSQIATSVNSSLWLYFIASIWRDWLNAFWFTVQAWLPFTLTPAMPGLLTSFAMLMVIAFALPQHGRMSTLRETLLRWVLWFLILVPVGLELTIPGYLLHDAYNLVVMALVFVWTHHIFDRSQPRPRSIVYCGILAGFFVLMILGWAFGYAPVPEV
ncbi:MAG: hypothetical protein ACR2O4_07010 [Hyphomicrobiaceae bacterium]